MVKSPTIPPHQVCDTVERRGENRPLNLRAGEIAQVRSEVEILATLDGDGCLGALPFMPEMRKHCGGSFQVLRRVNKIIVEGRSGLRRMQNVLLLDGVTCDGSAHGDCQFGCLLLWREQWLMTAPHPTSAEGLPTSPSQDVTEVLAPRDERFECQATSLFEASSPLPFWHADQYLWDLREGILSPRILARTWFILSYNKIRRRLGLKKRYLFHGYCKATPTISLNLQPGELVRVKNRQEIMMTLDSRGRNRGLGFTHEMLKCCGKEYRVLRRVKRMIVESTGRMQDLLDTVILEGAFCEGESHFNCHRRCRSLWKEIWLERV
jgi:hypothetical protein